MIDFFFGYPFMLSKCSAAKAYVCDVSIWVAHLFTGVQISGNYRCASQSMLLLNERERRGTMKTHMTNYETLLRVTKAMSMSKDPKEIIQPLGGRYEY